MGLETDLLVHPERLSPQLICPICTQVLRNPVQTPSDHLFCEDELLEWMTISSFCPVTKLQLLAQDIKKPSRIILNMLAELEIFCPNKVNGCKWIGLNEQMSLHLLTCDNKGPDELKRDIIEKDNRILDLLGRVEILELKCVELDEENRHLKEIISENNRKLRIFNALTESKQTELISSHSKSSYSDIGDAEEEDLTYPSENYSDTIRLLRLKSLNSMNSYRK